MRISAAVAAIFAVAAVSACSNLTAPPSPEPIASDVPTTAAAAKAPDEHAARPAATPAPTPTPAAPPPSNEKLEIKEVAPGKGAVANNGDRVFVHYTGTLKDGTEFDSSRKHGKPFDFTLGKGEVIKGWDQGILGMKVGQKRKLIIPPSLGYGPRGAGQLIPPNATLLFDVELVDVKAAGK